MTTEPDGVTNGWNVIDGVTNNPAVYPTRTVYSTHDLRLPFTNIYTIPENSPTNAVSFSSSSPQRYFYIQ